jgi:hypothetical protein
VVIPSSVDFIGNIGFGGCLALAAVVFEAGARIKQISKCAFFTSRSAGL